MSTASGRPIKAITFDFWNTLVREERQVFRDRRVESWLYALEGEVAVPERSVLDAAMDRNRHRFDRAWEANLSYSAHDAVADVLEDIDLAPSASVVDQLVLAFTDPDPAWKPGLTDNIGEALEGLSSRGVRIGIICDVGLTPSRTLRRFLQDHGLLGYFDHWSFSDEVGTFKPDPKIFHHALEGLGGIEPAAAAHIGDLRRTDVGGALNMGMVAIRYSGVNDDPGSVDHGTHEIEGDIVISDHRDLLTALDLV